MGEVDTDNNGLITPAEKATVTEAIADVATQKAEAQAELDKIKDQLTPEQVKSYQDKIDAIVAPENTVEVTDNDADGYSNADETTAGSEIDNDSSTPKSVAEALKEQAAALAAEAEQAKTAAGEGYTDAEVEALQEKADAIDALKAKALAAANLVKEDEGKTALIDEINAISFDVPVANDVDGDNKPDESELAAAESAVNTAKEAKDAYEAKKAELTSDDEVTQEDLDALQPLKEAADAAHNAAVEAVNEVPEGTTGDNGVSKASLEGRLAEGGDAAPVGELPALTTSTGSTEEPVSEQPAGTETEAGGNDSTDTTSSPTDPTESSDTGANTGETSTDGQPNTEPTAGDNGGDGSDDTSNGTAQPVVDTAPLEQALEDAKAAVGTANTAIGEADTDNNGLITPAEKATVIEAIADVETAKEKAQAELDKIKDQLTPEQVKSYQDKIDAIIAPENTVEVTDNDADGYSNTDETTAGSEIDNDSSTPKSVAEALKEQAAALAAEAEQAKTAVGEGYTDAEVEALQEKADAIDALKAKALAAANLVKEDEGKAALIDAINAISFEVPAANDKDADGTIDTVEVATAKGLVDTAAEKVAQYEAAKTEAEKDGVISQAELDNLTTLKNAAEDARTEANNAITVVAGKSGSGIPDGTTNTDPEVNTSKAELETRLATGDAKATSALLVVNDKDADGTIDTVEVENAASLLDEADKLLRRYENIANNVRTGTTVANPDLIKSLDNLRKQAIAKLNEAKAAVNGIPDGTEGKDSVVARANGMMEPSALPEANDKDADTKLDTQEVVEATSAVDRAAEARKAYEDAKTAALGDGKLTPTELADLTRKKQAADDARQTALGDRTQNTGVNGIPDGTEGKDALVTRLTSGDAAPASELPVVNDKDADGTIDTAEVANAKGLVDTAAQAVAKYEEAKTTALSDGKVTPEELATLTNLKNEAEAARTTALGSTTDNTGVSGIPDGTTNTDQNVNTNKEALAERLATGDAKATSDLPVVNDKDADGTIDTVEVANAKGLVDTAAEKVTQYEEAKRQAESDGKVTQTELDNLTNLKNEAEAARTTALGSAEENTGVNGIPDGTTNTEVNTSKEALATRLATGDAKATSELPELTATVDTQPLDDAIQQAINAVNAAKTAISGADQNSNGLITPAEKQPVTDALNDATAKKAAAQAEFDKIKTQLTPEQVEAYQAKLDEITVPADTVAVTDTDADGYSNDVEKYATSDPNNTSSTPKNVAEDLYQKALDIKNAAEALKTQYGPGYTDGEVAELEAKLSELEAAKQKALQIANVVREDDDAAGLKAKIDELSFDVPEAGDKADSLWFSAKDMEDYISPLGGDKRLQKVDYTQARSNTEADEYGAEQPADENGIIWREVKIPLADTQVYNQDMGTTETLKPTDGWINALTYSGGHGGYVRYKVDENGQLIIQIDQEKASKLNSTEIEALKVSAQDGTELTYSYVLKGKSSTFSFSGIDIADDVGLFRDTMTVNSPNRFTDDQNWANIKVISQGTTPSGAYVKLSIIDQATGTAVWSENQAITSTQTTFNASAVTLENGHKYVVKAEQTDAAGNVVTGGASLTAQPITIDTVQPDLRYSINVVNGTVSLAVNSPGEQLYSITNETDSGVANTELQKENASNQASAYKTGGLHGSITINESDLANPDVYTFVADEAGNKIEVPKFKLIKLPRLTNDLTPTLAPSVATAQNANRDGQSSTQDSPYRTTEGNDIVVITPTSGDTEKFRGSINYNGSNSASGDQILNLNTAGGDDIISATNIYSKVVADTGTGNDSIILSGGIGGEIGDAGHYDQRINMGDGNDILQIKGTFPGEINAMHYTATKISMGTGSDVVNIEKSIYAADPSGKLRSNYFDLGQGDDKINLNEHLRSFESLTAEGRYGSNIINLGKGNDTLTINKDVSGLTLIASRDSSTITIKGKVEDSAVFYLGSGADHVTLSGGYSADDIELNSGFAGGSDGARQRMDYLRTQLTPNGERAGWYDTIKVATSSDQVATLEADPNVTAVQLGSRPEIHLGDGNNSLTINNGVYLVNITSGSGDDTIRLSGVNGANQIHQKDYIEGTSVNTGAGNDRIVLTNLYEISNTISAGKGNDVIEINGQIGRVPQIGITVNGVTTIGGGEGRDELVWNSSNYEFTYGKPSAHDKLNLTDMIEQIQLNGQGNTLNFGQMFDFGTATGTVGHAIVYTNSADRANKVKFDDNYWSKVADNVNYFDDISGIGIQTVAGTAKGNIAAQTKYQYNDGKVTFDVYIEQGINIEMY
ncbi:hypothetical protein ACFFHK_07010 [Gallibacterium trehalosifermentans]|uniref:Minor extracellular protease Epr GA-like domain-containing protein n=1 Tax=Gallibacterium trehalosifermentans TaxID=516935 RepID=A0ABV6H1G7_9PAST